MAHAIGIDLGTTELRAAIYGASGGEEARASLFRLGKEDLKMPAAVGVDAEGELVVGDRARRLQIMRPRSIVKTPLALLGTRFDDLDLDSWAPLRLVRDPRGDTRVRLGERTFAPVQLVAAQLLALRSQIEEVSAEPLPPVTLTVPAGLGNLARRGLVDACTIAGVHLQRLLPATTAAAIEIHAQGDPIDEPTLAICDLGGGSFSAAIVEFREGGITVLGSASAVDAGARDIDRRLAERLAQEAAISCEKPDLCDDPVALVRLLDASEKAKIGLSDARERAVYLPFLSADVSGTKHLETLIAQAELEENIEDLIQRWLAVVQRALADSNRTLDDLRDVVLIGRGSHLPLLQDRLEEALERTPNLRWQDASGEATSEPASAPKVSRPNRTKKAKKNNKTKGSKGDFPEESAEDAEEDAAEEDVQGALGRRDGRSRNRYPVAFGAARMAAMLAGDPTIDVLEIDDVLGRPITFERGTLEPPTPPSAISSKAPGLEVESAAKLPEPLEVGGEFDALEVAAGENKREEEKKEKKEKKDNEPTAKDPRAERGSSDSIDPYESSDSEGGDLSARGDGPGDGLGGLGGVEAKREPAEDQEQRRIVADSNPDEAHDSEKEPAHSEELEFEDRPEPELLFAATATMPASHTELFEAEGDGATAHFFLREGPRDRYALGEHVLRGRQLIDVTFNVDINGILGLSFRKNFRGKEAQLYVLGGGGMPSEEVQALAAEERTKEEVLRKRRRTQELTLRLRGLHERGSKVLSELQAGIPEGDRIQLQATLQAMHDAVVAGSLEALETANSRLIELLGELPRAIQEAITTPIATETPVAVASS